MSHDLGKIPKQKRPSVKKRRVLIKEADVVYHSTVAVAAQSVPHYWSDQMADRLAASRYCLEEAKPWSAKIVRREWHSLCVSH